MEYADVEIECSACRDKFLFSASEQKFFEEKGFILPKKCPKCRGKENVKKPEGEMYKATCKACKKEFRITFDPKEKELLCRECYAKENTSEAKE